MDVTRLLSAVGKDRYSESTSSDAAASSTTQDEFGRDVITQCFIFPFQILDTDECTLPAGHVMRHRCAAPSYCVNTIGSYECVCPVGGRAAGGSDPWAAARWPTTSTLPTWPPRSERRGICRWPPPAPHPARAVPPPARAAATDSPVRPPAATTAGPPSAVPSTRAAPRGQRLRLVGPVRPVRLPLDRPQYQCQCPSGLMGNGRACRKGVDAKPRPMVEYDGVTPTAETLRNDFYCGCTKPVVDPCAGFPKCEGM